MVLGECESLMEKFCLKKVTAVLLSLKFIMNKTFGYYVAFVEL